MLLNEVFNTTERLVRSVSHLVSCRPSLLTPARRLARDAQRAVESRTDAALLGDSALLGIPRC
jgi:hypothetical protein